MRPRRDRVPYLRQRGELPTSVDVEVVNLQQGRRDSGTRDRIPLAVIPDGAVGGLLTARRCLHRGFGRRRVAERLLVGDEVVGQLRRIRRQLRLRARGFGRLVVQQGDRGGTLRGRARRGWRRWCRRIAVRAADQHQTHRGKDQRRAPVSAHRTKRMSYARYFSTAAAYSSSNCSDSAFGFVGSSSATRS